ncbi:MAG: molybdenum cofactor biosynthesis protein MoaE [Methanomicrobiales archaeon]|nr:molybdenum cofactor biosynthesis protein MoaE [Methanomicrobiales archaeon]
MIRLTTDDVDVEPVIRRVMAGSVGAVVTFLGVVRDDQLGELELETWEEAALPELRKIEAEARERWPLHAVEVIHRHGRLVVGDRILLIVVSAGHRKEAFAGCEYILERIKQTVPIWKKEIRKDGSIWVEGEYTQG